MSFERTLTTAVPFLGRRTFLPPWHNVAVSAHNPASLGLVTSQRWNSGKGPSLADSVLLAKEQEKRKEPSGDKEDEAKGPKPLTKWQRIGYIVFGVTMVGSIIVNAVLFGRDMSLV
jgi:hypothetical protein